MDKTAKPRGSIAFVAQKGGSGRSSTTLLIAVASAVEGRKVLLIDYDRQGSLLKWWERRSAQMGADLDLVMNNAPGSGQLAATIADALREGDDLVLIDTPPGEVEDLLTEVIQAADACVVVTSPSQFDIEALPDTLNAIRKAGKPFVVVLNKATDDVATRQAIDELRKAGLPVASQSVSYSQLYMDALGAGDSGAEYDEKLAGEAHALWLEVEQLLVERKGVLQRRSGRVYSRAENKG